MEYLHQIIACEKPTVQWDDVRNDEHVFFFQGMQPPSEDISIGFQRCDAVTASVRGP